MTRDALINARASLDVTRASHDVTREARESMFCSLAVTIADLGLAMDADGTSTAAIRATTGALDNPRAALAARRA
jgi:hypothetical protein